MKFQPDTFGTAITGYGPGWVAVGGQHIAHSLVLNAITAEIQPWPCERFDDLSADHFKTLVAAKPELVVFGSGELLRFPKPVWIRPLIDAGIGIETMGTAAACRTYNILAGEDRRVVLALLVEHGSTQRESA